MSKINNYIDKIFIGTSGWNYKHWHGDFYPAEVKQNKWLEYYAEKFKCVELNVTFYRLPNEKTFENWYNRTPDDFKFIIKASRIITHRKRLSNPEESMPAFLQNISILKEKLGPVLFQLPPFFVRNNLLLENFLVYVNKQDVVKVKPVFEFRHTSWINSGTFEILKNQKAAFCFSGYGEMGIELPLTADFVYLRRHGTESFATGSYSDRELAGESGKIKKWLEDGKEVYVFFNNDIGGHAPKNAETLYEFIIDRISE